MATTLPAATSPSQDETPASDRASSRNFFNEEKENSSNGPLPLDTDDDKTGMYHLRKIQITSLLEDEALGLLLHGTAVAGFYSAKAEASGWCIGDQIVEVNGRRVGSFDEFLRGFHQAKSEGMPIDFFVLRREADNQDGHAMEDLQGFFDSDNFQELSGVLHSLLGPAGNESMDRLRPGGNIAGTAAPWTTPCSWSEGARRARHHQSYRLLVPYSEERDPENCPEAKDLRHLEIPQSSKQHFQQFAQSIKADLIMECIMSNPYVQALRARRAEHTRTSAAWASDEPVASLPSRLATQRHDGLATLAMEPSEVPDGCLSSGAEGIPRACGSHAPDWRCCGGSSNRCRGAVSDAERDFLQTPRPLSMETFDGAEMGQPQQASALHLEAQRVLSELRPPSLDSQPGGLEQPTGGVEQPTGSVENQATAFAREGNSHRSREGNSHRAREGTSHRSQEGNSQRSNTTPSGFTYKPAPRAQNFATQFLAGTVK